ncbi:lipid-binding SYLF domain-containing protein [Methylomonas paludis]|uniref:Lipid-binding SYLF domain-containing protein n=1 Tax=Methylomonas paludis TaxID=1173101 RepID=A0A975MRA6_9GAMM|nr:lipid-binding SYLF domain-containing protein [Methylomonas paludis]QWF72086.1 lipid-binding SYLF domain-containing protein [Methylomonas paludis]
MSLKQFVSLLLTVLSLTLFSCQSTKPTQFGARPAERLLSSDRASSPEQIDLDVTQALDSLYANQPEAKELGQKAYGILVFPNILKGGFMLGAQYGTGALRKGNTTEGYYKTVAASYGMQAGVQTFGYALFFMSQSALDYLHSSKGWEIGMGPSIVVVDAGMAKTMTTTTRKADVYSFIFDQKGMMAGLGLQGSKIYPIKP